MLRQATEELESPIRKRVKTDALPVLVLNENDEKTLKRKPSFVEEKGEPKKIKVEEIIAPSRKRKGECMVYDREKTFETPQARLNRLICNVFNHTAYLNIEHAKSLFDFFKTHSLAELDLNVIINGASIFLHIIACAKSDGVLGPLVLNKLCNENLLERINWNLVGEHDLCKGETPLVVLCKGLYDKTLCDKVINSIFERVPQENLDNGNRYLINNKRITPLSFLVAKREAQERKEFNDLISNFRKMKI